MAPFFSLGLRPAVAAKLPALLRNRVKRVRQALRDASAEDVKALGVVSDLFDLVYTLFYSFLFMFRPVSACPIGARPVFSVAEDLVTACDFLAILDGEKPL